MVLARLAASDDDLAARALRLKGANSRVASQAAVR
jgi:hypothetical protein